MLVHLFRSSFTWGSRPAGLGVDRCLSLSQETQRTVKRIYSYMMTWQSVRLCHVETVDYSSRDGPNCTNTFHSAHEVVLFFFFFLSGDLEGIQKPNFCVCSITLLYPAVLLCLNKCFLSLPRLTCKPALSNIAALSAHEQKWRIFCKCGCLEGLLSGVVTILEFTLKYICLIPRQRKWRA